MVCGGVKLMPHRHPEDRVYTVMSGVFYVGLGDRFDESQVSAFPPEEAKRMLDFVAETAREAGLSDYRVLVNVGERAGQTIFHLHWHVLGGPVTGMPA